MATKYINTDLNVKGNLYLDGEAFTVNTTTVEVEDNILELNRTQGSPDAATATTSGIRIYRGDGVTPADFIFDDADDTWDLTNNLNVAGTITGSLTGNASTASKWATARTITIGDTGKSVDGSGDVSWTKSEIGITKANIDALNVDADTLDTKHATDFDLQYVTDNGATTTNTITLDTDGSTAIRVIGANLDTTLLRVGVSSSSDSSDYGFSVKYLGTGSGNNNAFAIFSDNVTAASQIQAFTMLQDGTSTFNSTLTAASFIKSGGTSSQFLKADGSVDSNTYLTSFDITTQTDPKYLRSDTSDTMSGTLNMANNNITNVNHITINDAGAGEGIEWLNGNGWKIYESPDGLTNAAGDLQIVTGSTRRATHRTNGDLWIGGNLMMAGTTITMANNDGFSYNDSTNTMSLIADGVAYTMLTAGNYSSYITTSYVNGLNVDADTLDGYQLSNIVGYHSGSDFASGTLVKTTIPANVTNGDSFIIEVTGKSYTTGQPPFRWIGQGYLYNNTIISYSAVAESGYAPPYMKILQYSDNNLAFWWPRVSYWNSFEVRVRKAGGDSVNRVVGVINSTEPTSTKKVQVDIKKSWTEWNDGAGSGLDADLVDGLQASQFLRSDVSDTMSGSLSISGGNGLYFTAANSRIYSNGYRMLEGNTTGTLLQLGENYTTTRLYGDVGIGTTSPSGKFNSYISASRQLTHNGNGGDLSIISDNNSAPVMYIKGTGTADLLNVYDNTTEVFTIIDGGNVGIGTTTPGYKLDVQAGSAIPARFYSSNDLGLQLQGSNTWTGIRFVDSNGQDDVWFYGATKTWAFGGGGSTTSGKKMHVHGGVTIGSSLAATSVATNGLSVEGVSYFASNVGIGTTSPSYKLDVNGSFRSVGFWVDSSAITHWGGSSAGHGVMTWDTGYASVYATLGNILKLGANGAQGQVVIDTNGYVGVGNSNPQFDLHVGSAGSRMRVGPYYTTGGDRDFVDLIAHGTDSKVYSNNERFHIQNDSGDIIINPSGNVGIGTTSPSADLHVRDSGQNSSITATIPSWWGGIFERVYTTTSYAAVGIIGGSTSVGGKGILYLGNANDVENTYLKGGNNLLEINGYEIQYTGGVEHNWYTSGTFRMRLNSSGNLGIGTTSPAAKLDVNGDVYINSNYPSNVAANDLTIGKTTTGDHGLTIVTGSSNTAGIFFADNDNNDAGRIKYQHSNNSMRFETNRAERMRIDNSGNVGIGTASPQAKLHVADGELLISSDIATGGEGKARLRFSEVTGTASSGFYMEYDGDFQSGDNNKLSFFDGTGDHVMTMNNAGNVGIGTTGPSEKLHINGGALRIDNSVGNRAFITLNENSSDDNIVLEYDGTGGGTGNYFAMYSGVSGWVSKGGGFNYIPANGYVGIGTTSPTQKLDVVGTVKATAFVGDGSGLTNLPASTGNITVPETITHEGDTDTYISFNNDIISLICGGVTMVQATENAVGNDVVAFGGQISYGSFLGSSSGYAHLQRGLFIQWGSFYSNTDATQIIYFPTTFTTTYAVFTSLANSTMSFSTSLFAIDRLNDLGNSTHYFFAIGTK